MTKVLSVDGGNLKEIALPYRWISIPLGDGTNVIPTGLVPVSVTMPACTLLGYEMAGGPSGSIKVDIWKDSYANFPPTNEDSICGGNEPEISSGTKTSDYTLTDWTKTFTDGDKLKINVDSSDTMTECTLSLKVQV